ncbi:hypothetical protein [Burkholderia gladioli]|uniref:hypothetical protein n=1 Tax=Burkholderia gladioli TaxID=28095 RepID=UPI0030D1F6AF
MDKASRAARVPGEPRISSDRMSPLVQAFLSEVGRSGVSDMAFKLALLMVPMLSFGSWKTVRLRDVARRAGIPTDLAHIAASELVRVGVLDQRQSRFAARKMPSFRLREQFHAISGTPLAPSRRCESDFDSSQ